MIGLLDTSVIVARAQAEALDESALPEAVAISVLTLAELQVGVLVAADTSVRARRLETLTRVSQSFQVLAVDEPVALHFAELKAAARQARRSVKVVDALIAATARAHDIPLYTRDADFEGMPGIEVVRV